MPEPRQPTAHESAILLKEMQRARKLRDKAVNKAPKHKPKAKPTRKDPRSGGKGSDIPTLGRTRKDIMRETT